VAWHASSEGDRWKVGAKGVLPVSATPTFFINGRKLEGAYPFSAFQQQITALLGL
jgi:protein-disulfide isomerase